MFKAIVINKDDKGYRAELDQLEESALPAGDVRVRVHYSTLNYKDGLAITGKGPVVRSFPMVPGIDFAGEVLESTSPEFKVGDAVLLNGWGVGEGHWGGFQVFGQHSVAAQAVFWGQVMAPWVVVGSGRCYGCVDIGRFPLQTRPPPRWPPAVETRGTVLWRGPGCWSHMLRQSCRGSPIRWEPRHLAGNGPRPPTPWSSPRCWRPERWGCG